MQALFGKTWVNDESWSSNGHVTTRRVERPRGSARLEGSYASTAHVT
jgi:hypothetical protein